MHDEHEHCFCTACVSESVWVVMHEVRECWNTMDGQTLRLAALCLGATS